MKKIDFIELKNGALRLVETTCGRNGYPSHLRDAIIGFETLEEAEAMANEHEGLEVIHMTQRYGQQLWERGSRAFEPYTIDAITYGDDYSSYTSEEDYFEGEIKPRLECAESFDEAAKILKMAEKVIDKLRVIDEDEEQVITCLGHLHEVMPKKTMSFDNDSKSYAIGVVNLHEDDENEEE